MKTVFIAGSTGYLGNYLVTEYRRRGWQVRALVRNAKQARSMGLAADELIEAEATQSDTLIGHLDGVQLVVSSLGITRQKDGLSYREVDYQANLNILQEALKARVPHFAYVHVLNASQMTDVPLVAAKQAFVDKLQQASISSTVIAPSGYFSDMSDFLAMAKAGRAWLFGSGQLRLNPIHGEDLATAIADATAENKTWLDIGGPDIFSHRELAELAFSSLGKTAKITCIPDVFRRMALRFLPRFSPPTVSGPAQFFLSAMGLDMVGEQHGSQHLSEHFGAQSRQD